MNSYHRFWCVIERGGLWMAYNVIVSLYWGRAAFHRLMPALRRPCDVSWSSSRCAFHKNYSTLPPRHVPILQDPPAPSPRRPPRLSVWAQSSAATIDRADTPKSKVLPCEVWAKITFCEDLMIHCWEIHRRCNEQKAQRSSTLWD